MEDKTITLSGETIKIIAVTTIGFIILIVITIGSYLYAKKRTATIVLPGGITYLGPSMNSYLPPLQTGKITISQNSSWLTYSGKIFPYSFSYPSAISLSVFPNDSFDSVTVSTNPIENVFLRVENLSKLKDMSKYISPDKKEYASIWWKQYSWKGLGSITEFTNSHGLKGYRAKYIDGSGQTPYDNVFFEVPQHPELVIWLSGKLFEDIVFDKIVDSINWGKK